MTKDIETQFEVKDITYDSPLGAYTFRIYEKQTDKIARVTITPNMGQKYESRHMSFFDDKSKFGFTEILELNNLLELEGISLKAIYKDKDYEAHPMKIFIKNHDESKWHTLDDPGQEILDKLFEWRVDLRIRKQRITIDEISVRDHANIRPAKNPLGRGH